MKKIHHSGLWAIILAAVLPLSCERAGDFTRDELSLIHEADSIMRVLTIEDSLDLQMLRATSTNLSDKALRSEAFSRLSRLMTSTVTHPSQDGVGIAGPQVGLNRRIVAVQRFDRPVRHGDKIEYPFEVYPNISIVWASDSLVTGMEGCLSIPGRSGNVKRAYEIVIEYTDVRGAASASSLPVVRDTVRGFTAVIFQHETDHLDGILYTDKLQ